MPYLQLNAMLHEGNFRSYLDLLETGFSTGLFNHEMRELR